jgi:NTE family protein
MDTPQPHTPGLLLTGGGARAAYQAGVLSALNEALGCPDKSPFAVYAGTSAGAINTGLLVQYAHEWGTGVKKLHDVWHQLHTQDVYETEWKKLYETAKPWMRMLGVPLWGGSPTPPKSLLNNAPLRRLLETHLQPELWHKRIMDGDIQGMALTGFDYTTGVHTTFYDSKEETQPWNRHQRTSVLTELSLEHVLASSALPLIFPSVHISGREFGDGAMRQTAPLSPLIKLGASRLLVVGGNNLPESDAPVSNPQVSPATILGHAMASIFLDQLGADIERIERLNELLEGVRERKDHGLLGLRPVELHVIRPSRRLDLMAAQAVNALPPSIQKVLGVLGVKKGQGGGLASYVLFEPQFTHAIMDLGYEDTRRDLSKVVDFLMDPHPQTLRKYTR